MAEEEEALRTAFHDVIVAAGGTHISGSGALPALSSAPRQIESP